MNLNWLPTASTPLAAAALVYAANGWPVFPLLGKLPAQDGGFKIATTDEAQIREWWTRWPRANIGALPAGFWALDVDPRHDGDKSLRALELAHSPLPFTLVQLTGSGGEHWVFRAPRDREVRQGAGEKCKLPAGLDTRVAGRGYIVVSPSIHPETKRPYEWRTVIAPTDAPDWLLDLAQKPKPQARPRYIALPDSRFDSSKRQRYAGAVLRGLAEEVAQSAKGSRNDALNRAWWRIAQFRDAIPKSEAYEALRAAALSCGLDDREIDQVLR